MFYLRGSLDNESDLERVIAWLESLDPEGQTPVVAVAGFGPMDFEVAGGELRVAPEARASFVRFCAEDRARRLLDQDPRLN